MPFNSIFAWVIKKRVHQIDLFRKYPIDVQREILEKLIQGGIDSEWGKKHDFQTINSYKDFKSKIELTTYEDLKPYIDRLLNGEQKVLWSSETKWFAKSSGTTSSKSKVVPVTKDALEECHQKGGKDLLSLYYHNFQNCKLYSGKHLIIGGSAKINPISKDSFTGDLSAILMKNLPWWAEIRRTPSREIALMTEWEHKIDRMAKSTINEDVCILVGVPSWTLVLVKKILAYSGKKYLKEVWPNLELYMHGGVSFAPYEKEFKELIGPKKINYVESYNASEGFFGIQDQKKSNELLLMLDYGVFYEFIPMSHYKGVKSEHVIDLSEVEIGVNYALVITTNAGLWRYIIGDTVQFTSKSPYRFKITGRTKSYINVFGEELIVDNAEKAISITSEKFKAQIRDFTAGPIFMNDKIKGGHEWLIEFIDPPNDINEFGRYLDGVLQELNSDYEAKRYKNMVLEPLKIQVLENGVFDKWLKSKNKLGGQNKIPRLSNNRDIIEELLKI